MLCWKLVHHPWNLQPQPNSSQEDFEQVLNARWISSWAAVRTNVLLTHHWDLLPCPICSLRRPQSKYVLALKKGHKCVLLSVALVFGGSELTSFGFLHATGVKPHKAYHTLHFIKIDEWHTSTFCFLCFLIGYSSVPDGLLHMLDPRENGHERRRKLYERIVRRSIGYSNHIEDATRA